MNKLPFMPGDNIWIVDTEDGYKVKRTEDTILGVVCLGEHDYRIMSADGEIFPDGEAGVCGTKARAEEIREEMLSNITFEQICNSVKYSSKNSPEEWEGFKKDVKKLFLEKVK